MAQWDDTDWFRSSLWDHKIAAAFEAKLKRARLSSRAQYIRIQGATLTTQEDPAVRAAGISLLRRVIADHPGDLQAIYALGDLAKAVTRDGGIDAGINAWRDVLAVKRDSERGHLVPYTDVELSLSELLLRTGDLARLREADQLLQQGESAVADARMFRNLVFRFLATRARVAGALNDPDRAAGFAREALLVAAEVTPSLPRHPTLGRPDASVELVEEMTALTASAQTRKNSSPA